METSDYDYELPKELIAQTPAEPRDSSRLMVIDRKVQTIEHRHFSDVPDFLRPGDLLVWNNTKVFKARLIGTVMVNPAVMDKHKKSSEVILNIPKIEIFLLRPMDNRGVWKTLAKPGRKLRLGMKIVFAEDFFCEVIMKGLDGTVLVQFADDDMVVREKANRYGEVPTPPYIKLEKPADWSGRYQTVYASAEGSVAAPTAGFHFTNELIEKIKTRGIEFAEITLHVGLGTFLPVKTEKLEDHHMHEEWVEITDRNAEAINRAKAEKRRIISVGTTTARALEGVAALNDGLLRPYSGDINIFIYPGFSFRIVDGLITNFHLPKSTLLMLVSAFSNDREFLLRCYGEAVKQKYRFYSFGDAMLLI